MTLTMEISIHALREEGDLSRTRYFAAHSISIHALREEGDASWSGLPISLSNFYPRPPRGGRPPRRRLLPPLCRNFYPRPPRGGRPTTLPNLVEQHTISIHALREEGDSSLR